jgi:hypothetical protein
MNMDLIVLLMGPVLTGFKHRSDTRAAELA